MTITLTLTGEDWLAIEEQMHLALGRFPDGTSSTTRELEAQLKPEPAPEPEPEPVAAPPKPKKGATKTPPPAPPVAAAPEPEPVPTPAPEPTAPVGETPSLETLKALVTQAVLAARKGNGAEHKITNLLPGFKTKTGLNFVMEAKEEHKAALHDLVVEAGLV